MLRSIQIFFSLFSLCTPFSDLEFLLFVAYLAFQEEFAKWEATASHLKPGIAETIRGNIESRPPPLVTLIEYSQPYDKATTGDGPTIDSVLPRFRDAGFASVLKRPLDVNLDHSTSDPSSLLYPHIETNDVMVGIASSVSDKGWTLDVLRICNQKLGHLWNVRLKAFCPHSSAKALTSTLLKQKLEVGSYVKGTQTAAD